MIIKVTFSPLRSSSYSCFGTARSLRKAPYSTWKWRFVLEWCIVSPKRFSMGLKCCRFKAISVHFDALDRCCLIFFSVKNVVSSTVWSEASLPSLISSWSFIPGGCGNGPGNVSLVFRWYDPSRILPNHSEIGFLVCWIGSAAVLHLHAYRLHPYCEFFVVVEVYRGLIAELKRLFSLLSIKWSNIYPNTWVFSSL